MKDSLRRAGVCLMTCLLIPASVSRVAADPVRARESHDVVRGKVSFHVATNVPGISVQGRSTALQVAIQTRETETGSLLLQRVDALVPVSTLATGMSLRDSHMRTKIFAVPAGEIPDLRFQAEDTTCALGDQRRSTSSCELTGNLFIRGMPRPFSMALTLSQDRSGLRVTGTGVVRLSAYGIEQPTQFGVRTSDEVKLQLELTATLRPPQTSAGLRAQR